MGLKDLKRGTTLYIETSSYSKRGLNENSEKVLGLKFNKICENFFLGLEIWIKLGPRTPICT
jgi:hypothetical protein